MGIVYLVFLVIAIPVVFFMLTWAVVTAGRLLFPEQPQPLARDPVRIRQRATAGGVSVPVGVREIREDQRLSRQGPATAPYLYAYGASEGLPERWREDLWQRRN